MKNLNDARSILRKKYYELPRGWATPGSPVDVARRILNNAELALYDQSQTIAVNCCIPCKEGFHGEHGPHADCLCACHTIKKGNKTMPAQEYFIIDKNGNVVGAIYAHSHHQGTKGELRFLDARRMLVAICFESDCLIVGPGFYDSFNAAFEALRHSKLRNVRG